MPRIQSDTSLASQHATALSSALHGGLGHVNRDEETTVAGNQTASQTIDDLLGLQQEIDGLVMDMMGNIQGLASDFQAVDQALGQGFYRV